MNRYLCGAGGFFALALLVIPAPAAGQTPPTTPPNVAAPHPSPDPKAAASSAPVTLTGCLERAKPASTTDGRHTQPANTNPPTAFALRTEATTASGSSGVVYKVLSSGPSVQLDQHVGHRVEVTGTLRMATNQQPGMSNQGVSPSTPSGSTGMETTPTAEPATGAPGDAPSVTQPIFVDSLKMIGGPCKPSTQ
jgi:hypothetical protein